MNGVLSAEFAILAHFNSVRIVLLVFHSIVVSLLTFRTSQSYFNSHFKSSFHECCPSTGTLILISIKKTPLGLITLYHKHMVLSTFFSIFFKNFKFNIKFKSFIRLNIKFQIIFLYPADFS